MHKFLCKCRRENKKVNAKMISNTGFNHALKCVFNLINFYIFASCMDSASAQAQRIVSFKVAKLTRIDGCARKLRPAVERLVNCSFRAPFNICVAGIWNLKVRDLEPEPESSAHWKKVSQAPSLKLHTRDINPTFK